MGGARGSHNRFWHMTNPAMRLLILCIAILLAAAPAAAQGDTVPDAPRRRGGIEMIGGARIGWPQKLSAYVGIGVPTKRYENGYTGWSLTVEPGLGGGLVGIGETTSGGVGITARRQLAILRTWGDPWLVGPDRTYLGADFRYSIGYVGLAVGGYVRIPEDGADPGVLLTASFVMGN